MDPRIEYNRSALRAAVLQLLQEQPYEAIAVDDITRRAGVARATFYVHFEDKDDLLRVSLAAPFDLLSQLLADPVPEKVIAAALGHLLDARETWLAMLSGSASSVIARTLARHLESRLGARGLHRPGRLLLPLSVLGHTLADAMLADIREWLQAEPPIPVDDLVRVLMRQAAATIDASRAV